MPWLAGDTPPPAQSISRVLVIPDTLFLVAAVTGAVLTLTDEKNWEQTGDMSVDETLALMNVMFYNFLDSGP